MEDDKFSTVKDSLTPETTERGRPTKFTKETIQKLIQAIKLSATYELAANYAGISYDSFNNWMKRGEAEKEGEFFNFFNSIKEAEGIAAIMSLSKIEHAAKEGNWQAAAWKLERRYPHHYGKNVSVLEHTGGSEKDAQPVRFTIKLDKNDNEP